MARQDRALELPDRSAHDFSQFPRKTLRAGTTWYRQHTDLPENADRGVWYFASHDSGVVGGGRFDLTDPHGTCYLASTELGAVNECLGPEYARRGWVDADVVAKRVLSRVNLPAETKGADVTSVRAATFRVTNEVATTDRYDITQAWAQLLHDSGYGGIYSTLRFTPGAARGLALFGTAGVPTLMPAGDPTPTSVREYVAGCGIEVIDPPALSEVRVVTPAK